MFDRFMIVASLAVFLMSCVSEPGFDAVYTQVTVGVIESGSPIPRAVGEPLMTITGKINAVQSGESLSVEGVSTSSVMANRAIAPAEENRTTWPEKQHTIVMDQASLNAVGLVEYAVEDPFEQEENIFRGVLFRDLLALWQVSPEATQVTITALDDYQVTLPIAMLQAYPVLLAQQQNGKMMDRNYRGPAMLVMPTTQYPSVKALANHHHWIWQITAVHVE